MAKSSYAIMADFRQAQAQVAELRKIAQEIRAVADRSLPEVNGVLASDWRGENADAYRVKVARLADKIRPLAVTLDQLAGHVAVISQNTYNAEQNALEIAKQRAYGGGGGGGR